MSRRVPLIGGAFLFITSLLEQLNLNSFYGRQAIYEVYTLMILMIGINESRYIIQKLPLPRLTWYYQAFAKHEEKQWLLNWFDSLEVNSRKFLSYTKEQLDFYLIHKEYTYVKKRLIAGFLENERQSLSLHFRERTVNLLNNIKSLENSNIKAEINKIAEESLNSVLATISDQTKNKEIIESSFEGALDGLRKGKMTYTGDKVIPMYLKEVAKRSENLVKLSPDEENKKFSLTDSQRKYLMETDRMAQNEYLTRLPDISTALKNTEVYQNIINRIKSRVGK